MLNLDLIRDQFPALSSSAIYFDNPGGTQVAQTVIQRIRHYLHHTNANLGGAFPTSRDTVALVQNARAALADFLNAERPEEIVFGPNMTTLTFNLSRSIGRTLSAGDELVVTRLDHDANIRPWTLLAEDCNCRVRWLDFTPDDCTLDIEILADIMSSRTKIVALGYASNAVGTINDVRRAVEIAHSVGALCYVDAVQYAPHGPIDVQALDCDFLVCSAYKFFGPHVGILYGKYEHLERLPAYKVRPASDRPPEKFETGTQNFEGIAGLLGAFEYLQWIGETFGDESLPAGEIGGRRAALVQAMEAIRSYEYELSAALLEGLGTIPGLRIWGITDPDRLDERVPTISFTLEGRHPREIATHLAAEKIYAWNGNYYALAVTERLGLEESGGMVRVGPVHYNTVDEVHRLVDVLKRSGWDGSE